MGTRLFQMSITDVRKVLNVVLTIVLQLSYNRCQELYNLLLRSVVSAVRNDLWLPQCYSVDDCVVGSAIKGYWGHKCSGNLGEVSCE